RGALWGGELVEAGHEAIGAHGLHCTESGLTNDWDNRLLAACRQPIRMSMSDVDTPPGRFRCHTCRIGRIKGSCHLLFFPHHHVYLLGFRSFLTTRIDSISYAI
ncbi:MAG: hypothetical protein ACRD1G_14660, partial [Acidimicrobiales bacterium]